MLPGPLRLVLLLVPACFTGVDPEDPRFFASGAYYRPEGLACGLAHELAEHLGGSCQGIYDPAYGEPSTGPELAEGRTDENACPEGHEQRRIIDNESSRHWCYCGSTGNLEASSGELRDVPAGSICGLSRAGGAQAVLCEGHHPGRGECPEGYRWRWVPDQWSNAIGEDCRPTACEEGDEDCVDGQFLAGADILAFCEVMSEADARAAGHTRWGCSLGECDPAMDTRGLVCGLHARSRVGTYNDLEDELEWFAECGEAREEWEDIIHLVLHDESARQASCLGQVLDVSDDEPCPDGLERVCTADYSNEQYYCAEALCWCDQAGSAQSM